MERIAKIIRVLGLLSLAILLILIWRANMGHVVQQVSASENGPMIKIRVLQVAPWSLEGLLDIGGTACRAEYYPGPGAPMLFSISEYGEDSLPPDYNMKIEWTSNGRAEVVRNGFVVFRWTGQGWEQVSKGY
ncbi:hypothetical protein [Luteolibacter soli]